ncbi:hypothetical protein FHR76_005058, partial [Rhizobium sp. RAS22]|nr:hypothetical protein [Rhizobium sp. RAS22]
MLDASLRPLQAYAQNVPGNWALLIVSAWKRFEPATAIGIKQRGLDGRRFPHQLVLFAYQ